MRSLLIFGLGSFGLFIFGQWVGGVQRITPDLLDAILLGLAGWWLKIVEGYRPSAAANRAAKGLVLFLAIGLLSMVFSPYGLFTQSRSLTQVGMMTLVIGIFWSVDSVLRDFPQALTKASSFLVQICGIVSWIGAAQFLTIELTDQYQPFDFSFMNDFAGGQVWYSAAGQESKRINSIMPEPALLGMLLSFSLGLILIRLGLLGKTLARELEKIVPTWAACGILAALLMCGSSLAYAEVIVIFLVVFFLGFRGIKPRLLVKYALAAAIGLAIIVTVAERPIESRLQPLLDQDLAAILENATLSSLAANVFVMANNLQSNLLLGSGIGAHMIVYNNIIDADFFSGNTFLADLQLNADTAASLLIRLLSETGIVGTCAYLALLAVIVVPAFKNIRRALAGASNEARLEQAILAGLLASAVGTIVHCLLRLGNYYFPPLWMLLAVINCSDRLLASCLSTPLRPST